MKFNTQIVEEVSLDSMLWAKDEEEESPDMALEIFEQQAHEQGMSFDDFIDLYIA